MPEIITKYPESLIKELKDVGGKCGEGVKPTILKNCPVDKFCSLPTGEICVYEIKDILATSQMTPAEWSEAVTGIPGMFSSSNLIILILIFGIGMVIGMTLRKKS